VSAAALVSNLGAHALQVGALVGAGGLLAWALRLRAPEVLLAWWRLLLAAAVALPVLQPWRAGRSAAAWSMDAVTAGAAAAGPGSSWAAPAIVALLAAGAAFRLGRLALGTAKLRRWRRAARPLAGPGLAAVQDAAHRAGARARVYLSPAVQVPSTYGVRRPVVLLPERFAALEPARQRDVLVHELLHVRRRDWSAALAEEIASAVLWFHPAVGWLLGRIRLAREQVVDAAVVARTGERRGYLETLLAFAAVPAPPAPAPALFARPHLECRIDLLMEEDTMPRSRSWALMAVAALAVSLVAARVVTAFPLQAAAAAGKKTAPERKVVSKTPVTYPVEAKKKGVQGMVVLDVLITAAGDVTDVKVVKGPEELRESAASGVRQWKYEPGDVDTRATLTIRYILDKKDGAKD
jgi:D-alanyl-D-alanine endopeptidase (penicillin-binding protein 7)